MVTDGNRYWAARQQHVTAAAGNLLYPPPHGPDLRMSQPVRRTFDILKAEAVRRRPRNLQSNGEPIAYAEIARSIGLRSRQAVGHWFRGRGEPSVQQMKDMAAVLGCHWLELVTDDTMVVFMEEERKRIERIRQLSAADLADLDSFLAVKSASKGET